MYPVYLAEIAWKLLQNQIFIRVNIDIEVWKIKTVVDSLDRCNTPT